MPLDEDIDSGGDKDESPDDKQRTIFPYTNQPINIMQKL